MEPNEQEGMNCKVKIESNQQMRQLNFPPSAESLQNRQQKSYEQTLQTIKSMVQIMKNPPADNGLLLYELQLQGQKTFTGIFCSHQSFSKDRDEQLRKIRQMKGQKCENNNSEINSVVDQPLNVVLSPEDIESCAAQFLNFFEVNRFDYTPEELLTKFADGTILSTIKARKWKHSDFKRNLRYITKLLLIHQAYFIQQVYKSQKEDQREEFQTQFQEEISFLRQTFNNENQQLDMLLPGKREVFINKLTNIPKFPKILERQKYLMTPKIIEKVKIQQEGQILIKIQQPNQILIKMEDIEK